MTRECDYCHKPAEISVGGSNVCRECAPQMICHATGTALANARLALAIAEAIAGRLDCLRTAVHALEGALRNVEWELEQQRTK